jgi:hypothetical protein
MNVSPEIVVMVCTGLFGLGSLIAHLLIGIGNSLVAVKTRLTAVEHQLDLKGPHQ